MKQEEHPRTRNQKVTDPSMLARKAQHGLPISKEVKVTQTVVKLGMHQALTVGTQIVLKE
jgi:hypothetical protein